MPGGPLPDPKTPSLRSQEAGFFVSPPKTSHRFPFLLLFIPCFGSSLSIPPCRPSLWTLRFLLLFRTPRCFQAQGTALSHRPGPRFRRFRLQRTWADAAKVAKGANAGDTVCYLYANTGMVQARDPVTPETRKTTGTLRTPQGNSGHLRVPQGKKSPYFPSVIASFAFFSYSFAPILPAPRIPDH